MTFPLLKKLASAAFGLFAAVTLHAAPITQLKVMTFNIWVSGSGGLTQCVAAIRASGADIVGLQECDTNAAAFIHRELGFHMVAADSSPIFSRYPIVASREIGWSRTATLELSPGQRVHLFNCHLNAYPYGPYDLKHGKSEAFIVEQENKTRMPDLKQLLDAVKPIITTNEPCFLVGDFNAPSHLDYEKFPWPTSLAPIEAGFVDSYRELHPGNRKFPGQFKFDEPGVTWTPKTGEEPEGVFDRIDFVYYSKGDGAKPTHSTELDHRNGVNPWPSDHRAVITTFKLTPPLAK